MTLDQFLDKLREDRDTAGWRVNDDGEIRDARCRCPIEHVAGLRGPPISVVAARLGLSRDNQYSIMYAADYIHATPLRGRLLKACGL